MGKTLLVSGCSYHDLTYQALLYLDTKRLGWSIKSILEYEITQGVDRIIFVPNSGFSLFAFDKAMDIKEVNPELKLYLVEPNEFVISNWPAEDLDCLEMCKSFADNFLGSDQLALLTGRKVPTTTDSLDQTILAYTKGFVDRLFLSKSSEEYETLYDLLIPGLRYSGKHLTMLDMTKKNASYSRIL